MTDAVDREQEIKELTAEVARLAHGGDPVVLEPLLRRLVALAPSRPDFHFQLSQLHFARRRYRPAAEGFLEAARLLPDWAQAWFEAGRALIGAGRHKAAIPPLIRALAFKPSSAECHIQLGSALINLKQHDEAELVVRTAIQLSRDRAEGHYLLGVVQINTHRAREAINTFQTAIRLRPEWPAPRFEMGRSFYDSLKFLEASVAFAATAALMPGNAGALQMLAMALYNRERHGTARILLARAIELDPPCRQYSELLDLGLTQADFARALKGEI